MLRPVSFDSPSLTDYKYGIFARSRLWRALARLENLFFCKNCA